MTGAGQIEHSLTMTRRPDERIIPRPAFFVEALAERTLIKVVRLPVWNFINA
jgi:hypothetical protein